MTFAIRLIREAQLGVYWPNYIPSLAILLAMGAATVMLSTAYKLGDNVKNLNLEISGDIGDATALMPQFRYVFKQ
jgi:hypothetical protein